jgi:Fe-S cluster biogenesis protein NfuA
MIGKVKSAPRAQCPADNEKEPFSMEEQVKSAIDKIRPMLQGHGGGIEFVKIEGKTVYVRLQGACAGCAGAMMTMKQGVERQIKESVPEVEAVEAVN